VVRQQITYFLKRLPNAVISLDFALLKTMSFTVWNALLAMGSPPGQGQQQPFWVSFFPIILMVVVFYFVLMRPQQKKAKDEAEMRKNIKPGDKILTSGGIIGVVVAVKEKSLSIRSADAKLEILKSAVTDITERSSGAAES
jgi:preprotein translocase subunit YajC